MDSMRSLNTSLPSTRPAPPEQLLQAFRTAALSVTNLYKSAVTDQNVSRQAGYQEALEDLLSFLDRENLGLQDGEGWRVRQWATERYDGSAHQQQGESDDERSEPDPRPRSVTPVREQRAESAPAQPVSVKTDSVTPSDNNTTPATREQPTSTPIFYFTGGANANASDDMQTDEDATGPAEAPSSSTASTPVKIGSTTTTSRGLRTPHRNGGQRHVTRASAREFTFAAGTKRKFQIPDFFDISNIGPRDGQGANKKGRAS